jgi:membrane dipeptidase
MTGAVADELHRRLLTLDTHLDAPMHFTRPGWDFGMRHDLDSDIAQLDLPRMEDGNLSGGFFVIYTAQGPLTAEAYAGALASALARSEAIDETIARFEDRIGLAASAAEARALHAQGRLVAFKSIENCYPIGETLDHLDMFRRAGVRLAGPVHTRTNQLADSSTDAPRWNGLSPLGEQWVERMNALGTVLDPSHASDDAFDRMLALSRTPLLASHSGARAIQDHPRNLDDRRIRALAENGGVIGYTTVFLSDMRLGRERAALFAAHGRIDQLTLDEQRALASDWQALDRVEPMWTADFERYMTGLLHVLNVAGIDHVCFGADWDGGGGLSDMPDITVLPRVTDRLVLSGYSEDAIERMWSGNVLRLLDAADAQASR